MDELLVAANPDPDSRLAYLLRLPLGGGMVFRTSGTWPRTKALYCYPVTAEEWPDEPEIVEHVPIRSCVRRGAAIDLVLDRGRENRSQLVFTTARGRDAVFWQSPRTRKQARPNVTTPTARAAGVAALEILVDTREQYGYRFASQQVSTIKRALPCGDYGITVDERLVAAVERKSLADLVSSLINGKLRYALGDLAALPRAAVVVEDRYSQVFKLDRVRPAVVADGLAELQVRWPTVPIVFAETRQLAEEWTYRYLASAHEWAHTELALAERIGADSMIPGRVSSPHRAGADNERSPRLGSRTWVHRARPWPAASRHLAGMARRTAAMRCTNGPGPISAVPVGRSVASPRRVEVRANLRGYSGGVVYSATLFGTCRSLCAISSIETSRKVSTLALFTNRAGRYMSHTQASPMDTS